MPNSVNLTPRLAGATADQSTTPITLAGQPRGCPFFIMFLSLQNTQLILTSIGISTLILTQAHHHNHQSNSPMESCSIPPINAQLITWAQPLHDATGAIPSEITKENQQYFPDNAVSLTTEIQLINKSHATQNAELISLAWSQKNQIPQAINWSPILDLSPLNRYSNNKTHTIYPAKTSAIITTAKLSINGTTCTLTSETPAPTNNRT